MTAKTKWIIYGSLALIAVLLIAIFSKNIVNGLENLFVKIAIYLIVFCLDQRNEKCLSDRLNIIRFRSDLNIVHHSLSILQESDSVCTFSLEGNCIESVNANLLNIFILCSQLISHGIQIILCSNICSSHYHVHAFFRIRILCLEHNTVCSIFI